MNWESAGKEKQSTAGDQGPASGEPATIPTVSVVMPCLNEEEALPVCIAKIKAMFERESIDGEIVVADNGSTDRSVEIAESLGVVLCHQPLRGYGNAYMKGFATARGTYIVMVDADDTYDFNQIPDLLRKLRDEDYDFVTGSRYLGDGGGNITFLHRFLGNPVLTAMLNTMFGTHYTDVYCGFRAFTRTAYERIKPISEGMEFNLELAINAELARLKIAEIAIVLAPRLGKSKLNTLKDGWRSLRMMILYAPNQVFLVPGILLSSAGLLLHLALLLRLISYQGRHPGAVAGTVATIFSVIGFQVLNLWLHAKTYSWSRRFDTNNRFLFWFYKHFTLESGLAAGSCLVLAGTVIILILVGRWYNTSFLPLSKPEWAPFAATLIIIGFSCVFSSIFISAMSMRKGAALTEPGDLEK